MSEEKLNEPFHWKNKLDELDHLPGEAARDKNLSWDKLHDRLRKKERHYKSLWYWVAAACVLLLLAVGLPWIVTNQNDDKLVTVKKTSTPLQRVNKSKPGKEENSVARTTNVTPGNERKKTASVPFTKQNHAAIKRTITAVNEVINDTNTIKQPMQEIIAIELNPIDTTYANSIVAIPVKKKLRVVHINEIGKPAEEEKQYARIISSSALQGKLFNRDDISAFSLNRNASDNFIKIKLSPSN